MTKGHDKKPEEHRERLEQNMLPRKAHKKKIILWKGDLKISERKLEVFSKQSAVCALSAGKEVRRVRRVEHATLNPKTLLTKN